MSEPTPPAEGAGFNALVGLVEGEVADGRATVTMVAGERHLNLAGTVHGGAIATLVDVAMGRPMASLIADDERPVTIEMKVNYLERGVPACSWRRLVSAAGGASRPIEAPVTAEPVVEAELLTA